jgi:hypothetical protein
MLEPKHVDLIRKAESCAASMRRRGIEITAEGLFDYLIKGLKWKVLRWRIAKPFGRFTDDNVRLVAARILEAEQIAVKGEGDGS